MREQRRFARVYYDDMVRDHPEVWRDDAMLATWLRLLTASEKAWPSMAELPRAAKPRTVARLMELDMVTLYADHHYELRGFSTDRTKRQENARKGPAQRWENDRSADVEQLHNERTTNAMQYPDQKEKETKPVQPTARADDPADAYWQLTGKYPAGKALSWIDDLTSQFGSDAVNRALAQSADGPTATLLGRTQDILRAESRELDRREREDEQRRLREKRAVPRQEEPWRIEQRKAYLERYGPDAA